MQDEIMVSVTMLAYNHGPYIAQALDSVFMQKTNFKFEVIVGEDCSPAPDRSREILLEYKEKYGDQLILVLHEKNVGNQRNALSVAQKVKGKYRCGLECDDYWTDPYKLQKQFDFLESHPEYSGCGADHCNVDVDGHVTKEHNLGLKKDRVYRLADYKRNGYTVHNNTLMRRTDLISYEDSKKLRERFPTMGDIFNFSIMYVNGPIYVFKDVMLAHRSGASVPSSFSNQQSRKMIYYSYMQKEISEALTEYYKGQYDFSFIVVNRIAEILVAYVFSKKEIIIDKKELKDFLNANTISVRVRGYFAFIRRVCYRGGKKMIRKLSH